MIAVPFPTDLRAELASAMMTDANSADRAPDSRRLDSLAQRASTYARACDMTPESMVVALRCVYEEIRLHSWDDLTRLRAAYDRLLTACLKAYFEEANRAYA
jgi:hypothetical protein